MTQRLTQVAADVVIQQDNDPTRVTQESADVVLQPTSGHTRLTQGSSDTVLQPTNARIRLTQESGEAVLQPTSGRARVTQESGDLVLQPVPNGRITQAFLEVAFSAPTASHGVWMGATATSVPSALRIKVLHLFMAVASVVLSVISRLLGHTYTQTLFVGSVVARLLGATGLAGYSRQVVADGASAYYRLDDTGTVAIDLVARQNGAYQAGYTQGSAGTTLLDGDTAVTLDGASGYVSLPSVVASGGFANGITLEIWGNPTTWSNWSRFFDLGAGQANNNIILAHNASTGTLHFEVYSGGSSAGSIEWAGLSLGQWQHLVATYKSSTGAACLYVNGVQVATATWGTNIIQNVTRQNNYLGRSNFSFDTYYQGGLDEAAIYPLVLTPSQVTNHYTLARTRSLVLAAVGSVRTAWAAIPSAVGAATRYALDMLTTTKSSLATTFFLPYQNIVLLDGPSVYYRLNETGGLVAVDRGPLGLNGTYSASGVTYHVSSPVTAGAGASFNGAGVTIPWTQPSVSAYSIECWLQTTGGGGYIVYDRNGGIGLTLTMGVDPLRGGTAGLISFYVDGSGIYIGMQATVAKNDGAWHHVVGVFAGTSGSTITPAQMTLYVDGVVASVTTGSVGGPTAPIAGNGNTTIASASGSSYFGGALTEVALYTYGLTGTQVQNHYNARNNSAYGGFVYLQNILASGTSVLALATQRFFRTLQSMAVAATGSPLVSTVTTYFATFSRTLAAAATAHPVLATAPGVLLSAASSVLGTIATAVSRRYAQALSVASSVLSTLGTIKETLYTQALAVASTVAVAIQGSSLYHGFLQATSTVGTALQTGIHVAMLAISSGHAFISNALLKTIAVASPVATRILRAFSVAMAVGSFVGTALGIGKRVIMTVVSAVAPVVLAGVPRFLTLAMRSRAVAIVVTGGRKFATMAIASPVFTLVTSNKNTVYTQAMAIVQGLSAVLGLARAKVLPAVSATVATIVLGQHVSKALFASARVFVGFLTRRTSKGSDDGFTGQITYTAMGSPGPYFSIDGDFSIRQPDQFVLQPRKLLGVNLRRIPHYSGWPDQTWTWSDLSIPEYQAIIAHWRHGGPWFTISWLHSDGSQRTARAHMHEPTIGSRFTTRFLSVVVDFTEVQPSRTEVKGPWHPVPWHGSSDIPVVENLSRKIIGMDDQGLLAFDSKSGGWFWLFKPGYSGIYSTAMDPHDPTGQTMCVVRNGPWPGVTRTTPQPIGYGGSIWTTNDGGQSWNAVPVTGLPVYKVWAADHDAVAALAFGGFSSGDNGYWNPCYDPGTPGRILCATTFWVNTVTSGTLVQQYKVCVCESLDHGSTWAVIFEMLADPIWDSTHPQFVVPHMAVSPDGHYWSVTMAEKTAAHSTVISRDGGHTWMDIALPLKPAGMAYWVAIDQHAPENWYVVSRDEGSVMQASVDNGTTFVDKFNASNLPANDSGHYAISWGFVLVLPDPAGLRPPRFYTVQNSAVTHVGGYASSDFITWTPFNWNLGFAGQGSRGDAWGDPENQSHFVMSAGPMYWETFNGGASFHSPDPVKYPLPLITNHQSSTLEVLGDNGATS